MTLASTLINEIKDKDTLINLFKDRDLRNRETIFIISNNHYIELLNNPASEELVNKLWVGQISTQGRFYFTSTQYHIIENADNVENLTSTLKNITSRSTDDIKSFYESFYIWKNSIFVKFYSKTFLFFLLVFLFQLYYNFIFYSLKDVFFLSSLVMENLTFINITFNKIEGINYTFNDILYNSKS